MNVPTFWAEARKQVRQNNHQVTVRRRGGLDDGQSLAMAEVWAGVTLQEALAGEKILRSEPLVTRVAPIVTCYVATCCAFGRALLA